MKGTVIRSTGSFSTVRTENGQTVECRIKGNFRVKEKGLRTTNPVAAGDRVEIEPAEGGSSYVITDIDPRDNYIIRRSINLSKEAHILAANIDQAFLVTTLHSPRTSFGFIDRFLLTCEAYHIPATILVNKCDLYGSDPELDQLAELEHIYVQAGYGVLFVSALSGLHLDRLKILMRDKTNLFSGHSGSGKSSLINALKPELGLRTGDISSAHAKGKHTTTFAEMFDMDDRTRIIDTPGVKEFGIVDMGRHEIGAYFPDIRAFAENCRFSDCLHRDEPGCAVKSAVEQGKLALQRYDSYLGIIDSEELENTRK